MFWSESEEAVEEMVTSVASVSVCVFTHNYIFQFMGIYVQSGFLPKKFVIVGVWMLEAVKKILGGKYENLCWVEVNGGVLTKNYLRLSEKMPVAPVLKSNAYGHGLVLAAKIFDRLKVPFFCADIPLKKKNH